MRITPSCAVIREKTLKRCFRNCTEESLVVELKINLNKPKVMLKTVPFSLDNEVLEVDEYHYLGRVVSADSSNEKEISWRTFGKQYKMVKRKISLTIWLPRRRWLDEGRKCTFE